MDGGLSWLGNIALTPAFNQSLGYPMQNKMGDYYDMVSDNVGANLAFSATFTGGQDVYHMRINAIPEPTAIALPVFVLAALFPRKRRQVKAIL